MALPSNDDSLIVATGKQTSYYGKDSGGSGREPESVRRRHGHPPQDSLGVRRAERAATRKKPGGEPGSPFFVGAGATGLETLTELLAKLLERLLRHDVRN